MVQINWLSGTLLFRAPGADVAIPQFDIKLALPHQPIAQVTVNLVDRLLQILSWNFAVVARELGGLHPLQQPGRERIGVRFDQANQSVSEHHDPYPIFLTFQFPLSCECGP